jgi:hypothetical protein
MGGRSAAPRRALAGKHPIDARVKSGKRDLRDALHGSWDELHLPALKAPALAQDDALIFGSHRRIDALMGHGFLDTY